MLYLYYSPSKLTLCDDLGCMHETNELSIMIIFLITLAVLLLVNVLLFSFSVNKPEKKAPKSHLIKKEELNVLYDAQLKDIKHDKTEQHALQKNKTTSKQEAALVE